VGENRKLRNKEVHTLHWPVFVKPINWKKLRAEENEKVGTHKFARATL
jgi:hypothetical protein